ncbi:hypothetical protein [Sphaerisporangium fuscum]|uniref:hypothetical protein n=1 Tax=Sphaerisporangium fuscum TaxID=2835868 RepID=UPI001BDCA71B|nr:hypothetical protein [Sphaerisporangium fuscum]
MRLSPKARLAVAAVASVVLVAAVLVVVLRSREHSQAVAAARAGGGAGVPSPVPVKLGESDDLYVVRAGPGADSGIVYAIGDAGKGPARSTGVSCRRFYAAERTAVCLRVVPGVVTKSDAIILDGDLREVRRVALPGVPSRARVSADGRMVSWTVFTTGDSYLSVGFATRTGILDTRTGKVVNSLETFTLYKDGEPERAVDLNYWGVTFTSDDNTFYATASTAGRVYLVKGDFAAGRMNVVREGPECPSLSPDGTRLAYKKRTGDQSSPWRLHVLDLRSGRETALAETANVDDQAAWYDDHTVMYARLRADTTDVWKVPADGSGTPATLAKDAFSPARSG